jgi:autotransporter-associated beta strand protein
MKTLQQPARRVGASPLTPPLKRDDAIFIADKMRRMKTFLIYACLVGTLIPVAQAQNENITWQTPVTIAGASDVRTQGTYYGSWAPYDGSANTLPVNGMAFQGNSDLSGLSTVNFESGYNSYGSPNTASANYNALLQYATYANATPNSLTWDGMTPGHTYLVEIWVNDGRNIGESRSETFTGGNNTSANVLFGSDGSGPGQYIIGQFVADSSGSETIAVTAYSSGANPDAQINLLQVRDITVTTATNYQSAVLADNPLAYYALNPASDPSGTSPDLSGNGNNGQAANLTAAAGPSPYITNAANFNGTSSSVDLSQGGNPGLLDFNGPITLEAWVQPSSSTWFGDILAKGYDATTYQEIVLRVNGPYGSDYFASSGSVGETGGVQTTNWTYVVLSSDGINCDLYVNGGLVAGGSDVNGSDVFPDDWMIGNGSSSGNTRFFSGNISQAAIYHHGLTAAQVQTHYYYGMYGAGHLPSGMPVKWSASNNDGVWDTDYSTNWITVAGGLPTVFNAGDQVLFDDTAGVPLNVTVNGTVSPGAIVVDASANNFTFSGAGSITGPASLVKEGSSTLTIDSPANLTGAVNLLGGSIVAGNNCLDSVSSVTITNNSTLDLSGSSFNNDTPIMVSGTGVNGKGAIYNTVGDYPSESVNLTLAGDTKFGGSARWDLATGAQISGPHNLTLDLSAGAGYSQWNTVSIGANVAGIFVTNGSDLGMSYMDTSCQNPGTLFTIGPNCQMIFYNGGFNGSIHVLSGGTVYIYTAPDAFNGSNLILENNAAWVSYYNTGANTPVNSAVTFNGVAHFVIGDHNMDYTNLLSGPGGFVLDYYNNEMVLSATNTYSGPTIIGSSGNSPEVALTGNGSISQSSLIFFGGNNAYQPHLDVSGRSDQTLTLAAGQTLAGIGAVNGSLVVLPGATISPSGTNTTIGITTGSYNNGGLTAVNSITLGGTTILKLNGSANDFVETGSGLTYGGTLNLVNISGSPLTAGQSFSIFSAASYTGAFSSITPPTPGFGLAWDTSQLNNGIISVVAAPVINSVARSGGNLVFSGTNGTPNAQYVLLTTANLATPLPDWVALATNSFDGNGNFSVTNAINPGTRQQFFSIEEAP